MQHVFCLDIFPVTRNYNGIFTSVLFISQALNKNCLQLKNIKLSLDLKIVKVAANLNWTLNLPVVVTTSSVIIVNNTQRQGIDHATNKNQLLLMAQLRKQHPSSYRTTKS
jgi:hypothetical protein